MCGKARFVHDPLSKVGKGKPVGEKKHGSGGNKGPRGGKEAVELGSQAAWTRFGAPEEEGYMGALEAGASPYLFST